MGGAWVFRLMSQINHIHRFERALCSADPSEELYQLAVTLRDEGVSQIDLYLLYERFNEVDHCDESKTDAILDTMDLIWGGGWAKGSALYPHELTDQELNEHRKST